MKDIIYDRNPCNMLGFIDKRIIDAFGLREYKYNNRSDISCLEVYDRDLALYILEFNYSIESTNLDSKNDRLSIVFLVHKRDWWKIRKIIFKFLRKRRWRRHVNNLLGVGWESWAFRLNA